MARWLSKRSSCASAVLVLLGFLFVTTPSTHAFPGCLPGGSADQITVISDLQMHDTSNRYGNLFLDETEEYLFAAIDQQFWRIPVSLSLNQSNVFRCPDESISLTTPNEAQLFAMDTARGLAYLATAIQRSPSSFSNMLSIVNYTSSQMTVFGPSLDLRSRETFNSIAYDPLTTTLWLCMGSTLALYDLSDPNNPAPGPKLSPKGFFPFVSGVAFDVPERKAFYISQDANRSGGKLQVLNVNLDTHTWSFVDLGSADTTTSDYMSVVLDGTAQYLYVAACSYSSWNASEKTGFAARLELVSGSVSWLLSPPNQTFRGVSIDDRDGQVYLLTNDPSKPIYAGATSQELSASSMTTMVIAYDTANRPGTAYAGVFAKSSSTDLAFFLHDATDGIQSGVDILSFSTGGCKRLYAPCLNFDGTCGCLTSTLFNSIAPVSKCSTNVTDEQPQFTLSSCSAMPPTVALPPQLMPVAPTETPTPELTPTPTESPFPPPSGANRSDVSAQTSGGAAGSGTALSAVLVLSGILIAVASVV